MRTEAELFARAAAQATSEITFAPLVTSTGTVEVSFQGFDDYFFSEGQVSLFDNTLGLLAWSYGWVFPLDGNVPWAETGLLSPLARATANVAVDTLLQSGHIYTLTMTSSVHADSDSEGISVQVNGLRPTAVPEPSVLLLLTCGISGVAVWRRRTRNK